MDPLSQAVAGAAFAQSFSRYRQPLALIAGALAGMAADLDVLIRSPDDPLLFLEFHRQFTHSLIFIPVGGLLVATALWLLMRRRTELLPLWFMCTLGYASHGLLDSCTSYGTQLFWPFANTRVAWDVISIVDPVFTLPVLVLVVMGALRKRVALARAGLLWGLAYLSLGAVQHYRAEQVVMELAASRGHEATEVSVKPSFANLLVWKLIYRHDEFYFVDAVRLAGQPKVYAGDKITAGVYTEDLQLSERQLNDIERFRWFSSGYIAHYPDRPLMIGDVRYSLLPHSIQPLWGIRLKPLSPDEHVDYLFTREGSVAARRELLDMLLNNIPSAQAAEP